MYFWTKPSFFASNLALFILKLVNPETTNQKLWLHLVGRSKFLELQSFFFANIISIIVFKVPALLRIIGLFHIF